MNENRDNYLLDNLKNERQLNIILLSHNAYWAAIMKISNKFKNFIVQNFGCGTSYIRMYSSPKYGQINDCDLITFYSSKFYNENELIELKKIASKISSEKEKRVSIGYSYYTLADNGKSEEYISIVSINDNVETNDTMQAPSFFSAYDLINLTLIKHDDYALNQKKILKRTNNK